MNALIAHQSPENAGCDFINQASSRGFSRFSAVTCVPTVLGRTAAIAGPVLIPAVFGFDTLRAIEGTTGLLVRKGGRAAFMLGKLSTY
jgi:hypothetical protein